MGIALLSTLLGRHPLTLEEVNLLVALTCRSGASALPERIFTHFKGCSSALASDKVMVLLSKGWS
jgi:hypothetical protein